jgi:molecular chaperone GrpE
MARNEHHDEDMIEPTDDEQVEAHADGPAEDIDELADAPDPDVDADAVQQEIDDLKNRLLRVSADYQNFVKRSQTNLQNSLDSQLMSVARDLVMVMDHFDRALDVDPKKVKTQDLLKGVQSIRDELLRALGKHGIERVDAQRGDEFDPNRHEAMMRVSEQDLDTNQIATQFQPGYRLGEKVIRPAGVTVAE